MRVLLDKRERDLLWDEYKVNRVVARADELRSKTPALWAEINRGATSGKNIQSAVFSECVYAQTLADQLGFTVFQNLQQEPYSFPAFGAEALTENNLVPRFAYFSPNGDEVLIQAGGHGGIDAILIQFVTQRAFKIEFKEPGAKTSEPDLTKYGEDGLLVSDEEWLAKYPQFNAMLNEQIEFGLNFWDSAGSNVNNFSPENVIKAVSENYAGAGKVADVICVEDTRGMLTMIPANHAHHWSDLRGEIRPAGRNPYAVWTPLKLREILLQKQASLEGKTVRMRRDLLTGIPPRGGEGVSRYKLTPLFFLRAVDVIFRGAEAVFKLEKVKQLNPTISAHMFFRDLSIDNVRRTYTQAD